MLNSLRINPISINHTLTFNIRVLKRINISHEVSLKAVRNIETGQTNEDKTNFNQMNCA